MVRVERVVSLPLLISEEDPVVVASDADAVEEPEAVEVADSVIGGPVKAV